MADAKRNRHTNWSKNETSLLKTLFTENESVLSAKLSNQVTNSKKKEVWEAITSEINLLGVAHRSISEVKTKWANVARGLKSEFSTYRKESTKTGGGPPPKSPSEEDERLISIMSKQASFTGIPGGLEVEPSVAEGIFSMKNWTIMTKQSYI